MAYISIDEFKRGLHTTRMAYSTPQGALMLARNVHINRGAEIEKRMAFVSSTILGGTTFGLASDGTLLYTFGSAVAPALPGGWAYQRLIHPDGASMTAIIAVERFGGDFYVVADFADGRRLHFLNGVVINDWFAGSVRASMTNNNGIATHLASLIDSDDEYGAVAVGSVITITGPVGRTFSVSTDAVDGGGTDNQTAVTATTQQAVAPTTGVSASGAFRVTGGSASAGVNKITDVTVNGVSIMQAADVDWTTSNDVTAQLLADSINAQVSAPNYNASVLGNQVIITAADAGTAANGLQVNVICAGNVICQEHPDTDGLTRGFRVTQGTASPGVNRITSITLDGATVATNVDWVTDNAATGAAIVAAINASGTWNAFGKAALGTNYFIYCARKGGNNSSDFGQIDMVVNCGGNVRIREIQGDAQFGVGNLTTLNVPIQGDVDDMSGGIDATTGIAQVSTVTIGGTFQVNDQFTITINDPIRGALVFGFGDVTNEIATAIINFGSKMWAAVGPLARASAVNDATRWNSGTGAGFLSMATNQGGLHSISSFVPYQNKLAFLGRRASQIWSIDPDLALCRLAQRLDNFGTIARRSPIAYGTDDAFLLTDSGIRSLQQSKPTDAASTVDVGTAIDTLITAAIAANPTTAAEAHSIIDPTTGSFWLMLNTKLYVLSKYSRTGVEGWSIYDDIPNFEHFVDHNGRLYARAGNAVYLYGGADNATYDTCEAEVTLPYIDGRKKATWKQWTGMDLAVQGLWTVYGNTNPENPTAEDVLCRQAVPRFHDLRNAIDQNAPAIKLRFVSTAAERALISAVVLHHDELEAA